AAESAIGIVLHVLARGLQVGHELRIRFLAAGTILEAQEVRRVIGCEDRGQAFAVLDAAAVLRDAEAGAQERLRGRGAQAYDQRRTHGRHLALEPLVARFDLALRRRLVQAAHQARARLALAEHGLGRVLPQRAGTAARRLLAQLVEADCGLRKPFFHEGFV